MQLLDAFVTFLARIAAVLFAATGLMLTYEVIARYFFTAPTIWAAELSQLCLIWGTLLTMAWCLRERQHIRVDAVLVLLPMSARRVLEVITLFVILVLSIAVTYYGWDIFHDSFVRGRTTGSMLDLPIWISEASIPFGFAVMAIQSVIEIIKILSGAPLKKEAHLG